MGGVFSSPPAMQAVKAAAVIAVPPVVEAVAAVVVTALERAKDMLSQKFSTVEISRAEVDKAKLIMNAKVLDWEESMLNDLTTGLDPDKLEEFGKLLVESLQLKDERQKIKIMASVKMMKFISKSRASDVQEVSFKVGKFSSVYGFLAAVKAEDGTITFVYAFHSLTFELALEDSSLTANDISLIKNSYGKFQALDTLRREGVIKSIKYTD